MMPRPTWLTFWKDHSGPFEDDDLDPSERRNLILGSLERSGFGWQVVFVAGFGFLADAYDIFSINTILPMIAMVYWQDEMPQRLKLGLNLALLLGSMFGQLVFGYFADRLGRRKVYGFELTFTILASLGFATASSGAFSSMSLIGLLIFWRLIMGIGVGADYPLSAVITSEFAPAKHRDTMLCAVFFAQPLGQLIAVLMAFAVTAGFKSHIEAVTATRGVLSCSMAATSIEGRECARTVDRAWRLVAGLGAVPAAIAIYFRFTIPESLYYSLDVVGNVSRARDDGDRYFGSPSGSETQSIASSHSQLSGSYPTVQQQYGISGSAEPSPGVTVYEVHDDNIAGTATEKGPAVQSLAEELGGERAAVGFNRQFWKYLSSDGNWQDVAVVSLNWALLDFTFYLLGVNSSSFVPTLFGEDNGPERPPYSILIGEARHIMESSTVGALVGSLLIIGAMQFRTGKWFPRLLNSPRRIQTWGFGILALLFIIVGSLYYTLPKTRAFTAIVFFYQVCNLFYNFGPNTSTFILPAQLFPTKFRCTCYGIAAASGKLGSVLGQLVVTEVQGNKKLGATLMGFALVMVAGTILSATFTPETVHKATGLSLDLETLSDRNERRRCLGHNQSSENPGMKEG